jgi:hypothetical protein
MARERYDPMTGTWSRSSTERYEEESARKTRKPRRKSTKKRKATRRRKTTNRGAKMARRRGRRKSVGAGVKRRRRRSSARTSGRVVRRRSTGRRRSSGAGIRVRRRRRSRNRGFSGKGIMGQLIQAGKDGAWTVAGDVAANMAQIMSKQTGVAGIGAQIAGGFAAGYVVSKYVNKDAGRFVMAGAAAGIVKKLFTDNVLGTLPAGSLKTTLTAALQGYPHTEYMAQINGYPNVDSSQNDMGLPMGFGIGQGGI